MILDPEIHHFSVISEVPIWQETRAHTATELSSKEDGGFFGILHILKQTNTTSGPNALMFGYLPPVLVRGQ